ncbi:MAG: NUDIX hydrolase [Beijerinckiaceae bacterium]
MNDLPSKLDAEQRTRGAPPMRPVDASTVILVDQKGRTPKILLGRRNASLKFMPGKYVFPGGRVDPMDRVMVAMGALAPRAEARLMLRATRMTPQRCRALAMAAIRETFEETGYMIGTADFGTPDTKASGSWRAFIEAGVHPTPDVLAFVARAITPPGRPRRFDTRFFAADIRSAAVRIEPDVGPDSELTELVWATPDEATRLDLPMITQVIVEELRERLAEGLDRAHAPVPFYYEINRRFRRETL